MGDENDLDEGTIVAKGSIKKKRRYVDHERQYRTPVYSKA